MESPVARKVRSMGLHQIQELNRLAYDPENPGIARSLAEAVDRANQLCSRSIADQRMAECLAAMTHARANPGTWVGALTVIYGASLAGSCWSKLDPNDIHELSWRFDKVAQAKIEAVAIRLQTLQLARELLMA